MIGTLKWLLWKLIKEFVCLFKKKKKNNQEGWFLNLDARSVVPTPVNPLIAVGRKKV